MSYIPWPFKGKEKRYLRKKLKRSFITQTRIICGKTKITKKSKPKYTPEEWVIRKKEALERRKLRQKSAEYKALKRQKRELMPWVLCIKGAKRRAQKKNLPFDLTDEWGRLTYTGKCALTNIPFIIGKNKLHRQSPTIDKITPSLGYTKDNCRWVLFCVNAFKSSGTDADMLSIATALVNNVNI